MSYTLRKVYIDWDYTGTGSPDYSQSYDDISDYVQKVDIVSKNTPPIGDVGTCKLTLDNTDRFFSYDNANSAIYHKYKGELPVKVVAYDHLGNQYIRFNGFTDRQGLKVTSGLGNTASITCSNIMKLLQGIFPAVPVVNDYRTDQLLSFILGYALNGTIASDYIFHSASSTITDGTITVNGTVYTLTSSTPVAPYQIKIETAYAQNTIDNLANAINGALGAGVDYSSDITTHTTVTATTPADDFFRGQKLGFGVSSADVPLNPRFTNIAGSATIRSPSGLGTADAHYRVTSADGDTWDVEIEIPVSGTYVLLTQTGSANGTGNNNGILKIYADGVLQATHDLYNVISSAFDDSIVLTAGTHTIRYKVDGKNASSAGYTLALVTTGIRSGYMGLQSRLPGTVGNTYTLAVSGNFGTNSTLGGATFSGGTNEPNGLTSFDTGRISPSTAGDSWGADTNALAAIGDVSRTETGWFFVAMDGTVTFKNRDFLQTLHLIGTPKVTIDNQATLGSGLQPTYNRFKIQFKPRTELVSGIIASTTEQFRVRDNTGTERTNANDPLPDPPATVIILPAIDPNTKEPMGILSVVPPVPGTHFNVGYSFNLSHVNDFFTNNPQMFGLYAAINGSNIELTARMTNNGATVILSDIEIHGIGIVKYEPVSIAIDKENNTDRARVEYTETIPLPIDKEIINGYLEYLRDRFSEPEYIIDTVDLGVNDVINGVEVINLQIGDLLQLGDDTLYPYPLTTLKHFITGMKQSFEVGNVVRTTLYVQRCIAENTLILDHATYGQLDNNSLGY